MRPLTITCSDGGLRGGFVAGALTGLVSRFSEHIARTATFAAASASVGSLFYYLSHGDKHPGRHVWISALSSKKFASGHILPALLKGEAPYNIDYMVDTIFHKEHPLDLDRIYNTHHTIYVPVLNCDTMNVEYITNRPDLPFVRDGRAAILRDLKNYDVYEIIRASNAAPILYDKAVKLGEGRYVDAGQIVPYIFIPPAGESRQIVIATKYRPEWVDSLSYIVVGLAWSYLVPLFRRSNLPKAVYRSVIEKPMRYHELAKQVDDSIKQGNTLLIAPEGPISSQLDNREESLRRNFAMGEGFVARNEKRIAAFLGE